MVVKLTRINTVIMFLAFVTIGRAKDTELEDSGRWVSVTLNLCMSSRNRQHVGKAWPGNLSGNPVWICSVEDIPRYLQEYGTQMYLH